MNDDTTLTKKPVDENRGVESSIFNVSVRGWLALMAVGTVCYRAIVMPTPDQTLHDIVLLIVGFFFGKTPPKPAPPKP